MAADQSQAVGREHPAGQRRGDFAGRMGDEGRQYGEIENPYKKLPAVSELLAEVLKSSNVVTQEQLEKYEQQMEADEDTQVNNGGLVPIAYQQMLQRADDAPMKTVCGRNRKTRKKLQFGIV